MPLTWTQHRRIYLLTLALAISIFLGLFDFITNFRLEMLPVLSVQNITGIGLLYLALQIYKHQVDYY